MNRNKNQAYIDILKKELIPAIGCTEPTAIALVAARTVVLLGRVPERIDAIISGDIIKNAKSAVVPNTGGRCGIKAAMAAGVIAGRPDLMLEALSVITEQQQHEIGNYLNSCPIKIETSHSNHVFLIDITAYAGDDCVRVKMQDSHTNIVLEEKNGDTLLNIENAEQTQTDEKYGYLNVADIVSFAQEADISDISEFILRQIEYNVTIAEEGLQKEYGANIGKTLISLYGNEDVRVRAKARAAAGSDARMSGSTLPVVVVSGSGNQGITACVPVVEYAKSIDASQEQLIRAVALSDLFAIYLKHGMGKLSAFCGALCAGIGAACGIAFLDGKGKEEIAQTIDNSVGILSGMICDGAKASCAAKIAASVDSAIFSYEMCLSGQKFCVGDGIVAENADKTVQNIARLGSVGLKQADMEILEMMLQTERNPG